MGFIYAVGNSLFGGSAEYVGLWFTNANIGWLFPVYVLAVAIFGLITMLYMYDDRKHSTLDFPTDSAYARTKADFAEIHRAEDAQKQAAGSAQRSEG